MGNTYLFGHVTASDWVIIILVTWVLAIISTAIICMVARKKGYHEVPGFCSALCSIFGLVGGVSTLNLIANALRIDLGPLVIVVLLLGGGAIGYSAYKIGEIIISR